MGLSKRLNQSFSSHFPNGCFQSILKLGLLHCSDSLNQFVYFLAKCRRYRLLAEFVPQLNRNFIAVEPLPLSYVAQALLKLGELEEAERIFKPLNATSSVFPKSNFWNSLIQAYCLKRKHPEKGYLVLRECWRFYGVVPSIVTFNHLICSFCSQAKMSEAIEVLETVNRDVLRYPLNNYVCGSVICGFCKVGKPELAFEFLENAVSFGGLKPNIVTYTAFLCALCMLGRAQDVSKLVRVMENEGLQLDAVLCGSWIHSYLRKMILLETFSSVNQTDLENFCYNSLIADVSKNWNVKKTCGFSANMVKQGLMPNRVTLTSVVRIFCRNQKLDEVFTLFGTLKDLGMDMDEIFYNVLLDEVYQAEDIRNSWEVIDERRSNSAKHSQFCYKALIRNREGISNVKRRIEESEDYMDIILFNTLIKSLFMVGQGIEASVLYYRMKEIGLLPDSNTFKTIINGCCQIGKISEAIEIFNESKKYSFHLSACYNFLILGFCKNKMVDLACELFLQLSAQGIFLQKTYYLEFLDSIIKEKGSSEIVHLMHRIHNDLLVSWTINFLCKHNCLIHACELLVMAKENQLKISAKLCELVFDHLFKSGNIVVGLSFLSYFVKEFGLAEPFVMKALIYHLCGKNFGNALLFYDQLKSVHPWIKFPSSALKFLISSGRLQAACNLISRYKSELSFNITDFQDLINELCKKGSLMEALELCEIAQDIGFKLPIAIYNLIIHELCLQGSLLEACRLFFALQTIGLDPSEMTYGIIIHNLCKDGYFSDAKQYLEKMMNRGYEPNCHIYNSFIYGYSKFNLVEDSLQFFSVMEEKNISPDGYSISAVIDGYCRRGDIEGALRFFLEYKEKNLDPDLLGFVILIRGLCYKGRMEEARSVLREMIQCKSVTNLINQLCVEDTKETAEFVLGSLCEEGMIWDAVRILTDVAAILFPSSLCQKMREPPDLLGFKEHYDDCIEMRYICGRDNDEGIDFRCLYQQAANHCVLGNTSEANNIVKQMLSLLK